MGRNHRFFWRSPLPYFFFLFVLGWLIAGWIQPFLNGEYVVIVLILLSLQVLIALQWVYRYRILEFLLGLAALGYSGSLWVNYILRDIHRLSISWEEPSDLLLLLILMGASASSVWMIIRSGVSGKILRSGPWKAAATPVSDRASEGEGLELADPGRLPQKEPAAVRGSAYGEDRQTS